ncbi:MAG TPA: ABC transporter ATP-binding protein [Acidimicrobiia bacterium]|nr:ABC transporter ATP-binding protein [Acidimicrobiia bacterium]
MTQTEAQPPEFQAADRAPVEGLGWFRRWMQKYVNAFSVARASLFWALLKRQKKTLKWLFIVMIIYTIGLLQVTNLTRGMIDNGIVDQTGPLWQYVRYITFWALWALVFGFIQQQIADRLAYQIEFDMRVWLYTHIQSADLRRLDRVATGQLVTRSLTDVQLVDSILATFPTLIGYSPIILAVVIIVAIASPIMGVLAVLALPINIWLTARFRKPLRALSWAELNERAEVTTAIDEPVRGIRVVKAFGREPRERARVADTTERAFRFSMTRTRLVAGYELFLRSGPLLVQAVMLAAGAYLMSIGHLTVGTFFFAFQIGSGINQLSAAFGGLASAWQYLRSAQDRLAEMLALSSRPVTDGRMIPLPSSGLELSGLRVTFGNTTLLHGLGVQVRPGELVVVSGPPGSGKTLLAGIASGLVDPDEGLAALDGIPLAELDQPSLRRTIRVVSEEPLLLAATLRDNLLLGAFGEIEDATMLAAMRTAGAEEVVEELGGLDGVVGDRGLTVSGGQRQRVSLARALVAHPRVLILDDALSAVQPALEVEIMRRVRRYLPDTAILYITRRTGLADIADRAVTLAPAERDDAFAQLASAEMLSGTAEADFAAQSTEAAIAGHAAGAMDAADQVGLEAEVAEGAVEMNTAALASLAQFDPTIAKLVEQLKVTTEELDVPESVTNDESRPRFWKIAMVFKGVLALAGILMLGYSLLAIAPNIAFGQVTDAVQNSNGKDASTAYLWALLVVFIAIGVGVLFKYSRIAAQRFNQSVILVLRRRVFYRLSKLGVNFYDRELPGDVATRVVADLDRILGFVQESAFQFASAALIAFVALTAIVIMAPGVLPVVLALLGIIFLVTAIQFPFASRAAAWSRQELGTVTRQFQEDFGARHEIRHLGAHAIQTKKFVEASWERRRARWWTITLQNSHTAVIQFLGAMTTALVLYKTGTLVLKQEVSIGTATSVALLANVATQPLQLLAPIYNQFLEVRVSWRRLCEPFDEPILPGDAVNPRDCPRLDGPVTFEQVAFTYPGTTRPVLRDVTFTMEPGKVTALVGYTGAGKSSIAKLLGRTYDPDAGCVKVSGIDLRELRLDTYRPRLGVVPQDPFLFKGTIATNIRYAKPDAADEEVEGAVRAVGAWEMLAVLPGGFDHPVEEEGHNLTAAQRQLVALARAWIAQPDILVLDESTSLLDAAVEDVIIQALHNLRCTTLMITHRETVAVKSDNIVVLDKGRVVDAGPEEQVARPGGPYDKLWRVQEEELAEEKDKELTTG